MAYRNKNPCVWGRPEYDRVTGLPLNPCVHLKCHRCSTHRITQDGRCTICGRSDKVSGGIGPSRWWRMSDAEYRWKVKWAEGLGLTILRDVWVWGCALCDRAKPNASKGPRISRPKYTRAQRRQRKQRRSARLNNVQRAQLLWWLDRLARGEETL